MAGKKLAGFTVWPIAAAWALLIAASPPPIRPCSGVSAADLSCDGETPPLQLKPGDEDIASNRKLQARPGAAARTPPLQLEPGAEDSAATARENPAVAAARARVLGARPLAMYYYVNDARAQASAIEHASRMTVLAPQCYWVEKDGVLRGLLPPQVAAISRRARLPVMPLIFNRGFNRETVTALLHSPPAERRAAAYMAYHAARENLTGFQIDLENIDPADQERFTEFVRSAAERLHADGRLLSVALVPRFTDAPPGPASPEHPTMAEWAAAYDYRALGEIADFLTLMTYDHFNRLTPAGPIAGLEWVKKALVYAEERIPADKLLVGIPLYGREWTAMGASTFSRSLTAQRVSELRGRWHSEPRWDERWQSPWFQFHRGRAIHTVWYEDSRSWNEKLSLIREYHLRGFAAWRLGFEGSAFWSLMGSKNSERNPQQRPRPNDAAKSD